MNIREFSRNYAFKDDKRAWIELSATLLCYGILIALGVSNAQNPWISVPASVMAGLMGVRIYMVQHDCIHRAFFRSRDLNDLIGTLIAPIAMTPYRATRYNHNLHHAHVGDLDHREAFEIDIMTVEEYRAASPGRQLWYRFYRSPFTLLLVGPFVLYLILRRFPRHAIKTGVWDVILHDLAIVAYFSGLYWLAGWPGVFVLLGSIYVGATFGALIPYVVHNFEQVYWGRKPEYTNEKGALEGSSVLDFGALFDLLTANIAYHDLHHLNANIPCYRLKKCYVEAGPLLNSHKIGWREALGCYGWKLYDEKAGRMVGFDAAGQMAPLAASGPAE